MTAPYRLEWRRRFPSRALRRLCWFLILAAGLAATAWVMFGTEPDRLESGDLNPLALVPPAAVGLLTLAGVPFLLAVVRRPMVSADHYALTIRPGAARTLVLPWAAVAEIAGRSVRGDPLLLVRRDRQAGQLGDRARWYDQGVLRAAARSALPESDGPVTGYDLAIRMDEFAGDPPDLLAALAAWAPPHVRIA